MATYPEEFKAKIIAQMLPPHNRHIPELARESGIPPRHALHLEGQAPPRGGGGRCGGRRPTTYPTK
jgi:transposase-like protein